MKSRIEYRALDLMGASELVLDFYSITSPLDIFQLEDGTYEISGAIDASAENDADLLRILEDTAKECLID